MCVCVAFCVAGSSLAGVEFERLRIQDGERVCLMFSIASPEECDHALGIISQ